MGRSLHPLLSFPLRVVFNADGIHFPQCLDVHDIMTTRLRHAMSGHEVILVSVDRATPPSHCDRADVQRAVLRSTSTRATGCTRN